MPRADLTGAAQSGCVDGCTGEQMQATPCGHGPQLKIRVEREKWSPCKDTTAKATRLSLPMFSGRSAKAQGYPWPE